MNVKIGDSTWPLADPELEWRLRFEWPTTERDALHAASIISAYRTLIDATQLRRAEVIRKLRAAAQESDSHG